MPPPVPGLMPACSSASLALLTFSTRKAIATSAVTSFRACLQRAESSGFTPCAKSYGGSIPKRISSERSANSPLRQRQNFALDVIDRATQTVSQINFRFPPQFARLRDVSEIGERLSRKIGCV